MSARDGANQAGVIRTQSLRHSSLSISKTPKVLPLKIGHLNRMTGHKDLSCLVGVAEQLKPHVTAALDSYQWSVV